MERFGFLSRMNPTVRGFLIIFAIAGIITALSLESTLDALTYVVRIAFFIAIAFFLYLVWRERRDEIAAWPTRPKVALYGGAFLALANVGVAFLPSLDYPTGVEILVFIAILAAAGFAMWRAWRDQTTYSY